MAAKCKAVEQASLNFCENDHVFWNSECQCCAFLRSGVCYLVNELKSMTEIINILKEEATYDRTRNYDQRTYSECIKKPTKSTQNLINTQNLKVNGNQHIT